jgi:SAM-dependent methyltransferase
VTTASNDYDPFARAYARYWGPGYTERVLPHLEPLALDELPRGAAVLDLCCGTGDLAARLVDRGLDVTGVDAAGEMLRFARKRAPGARFVHADARDFELDHTFRAVLCLFDSLNHVEGVTELAQVFHRVRAVLEPGGLFLFDLNTEPGYIERWNDTFGFADDDLACLVRSDYDGDARLATFDAAVFELQADGAWGRTDVRLMQRPHDVDAVTRALNDAAFTDIRVLDGESDLGFGGPGRAFLVAR